MTERIQGKLGRKKLYSFERITPKTITTNKIDSSGDLITKDITVYGRMIPLTTIIKEMKEAHKDLQREVSTEGTQVRYIKLWHDHSDILNHSYLSIMASTLYDSECFLTNAEYREKFPERPNVDVQALVEKPFLYILGQSSCSDVEQLSYMPTRIQDLDTLRTQEGSIQYAVRFFSGDGPARQFEAGHQRGGNYSCLCGIRAKDHLNLECALRSRVPSLEDRMKTFRAGQLWKRSITIH